jgi:nucleotide-binding universal stress UspA family protein
MAVPKTIVLPLDGSETSGRAVPFAEGVARATGAALALVRGVRGGRIGDLGSDPFRDADEAEAQEQLSAVSDRLRTAGLQVSETVSDADPADAIVQAAERSRADIIAMATHGRTGLRRTMYGSVAEQVLRGTTIPVLLVSPSALYRMNPPCTIVVALDGSELAEAALSPAFALARALRGRVILVRAAEAPTYWLMGADAEGRVPEPGSEADHARRYLEDVAERIKPAVEVTGYVTDGSADEVVIAAAREHHAGLVAMATHARTGIARMMVGSVTERVLREASIPLLLVHPGRNIEAGARGATTTTSSAERRSE